MRTVVSIVAVLLSVATAGRALIKGATSFDKIFFIIMSVAFLAAAWLGGTN